MSNPTTSKNLEFDTIRQVWNKYKLENGIILRTRFFLSQIFEIIKDNTISYEFKVESQTTILQNKTLNDPNYNPSLNEPTLIDVSKDLNKEMKFEVLINKSQIYELENKSFLFLYEKINKIWSTKKFDRLGNVIYYLDIENKVNIFKPNI